MDGFGEKIKELRKSKNVSQEELAFDLGVSRQTINKWEANAVQPSMESITALCKYFGVKYDYFFGDGPFTEETAAAADNGGDEAQAKGKNNRFIICLSLLVVSSVLFAMFTVLSLWSGMTAFSDNRGFMSVSSENIHESIFIGCLIGSIISLVASVVLIFLLKKFKK